jgi:hypothetical protein
MIITLKNVGADVSRNVPHDVMNGARAALKLLTPEQSEAYRRSRWVGYNSDTDRILILTPESN